MRLVTFHHQGRTGFGCVEGDRVLDFAPHGEARSLRDCLPLGIEEWRRLADAARGSGSLALADVRLTAPIPDARKFLALGGNYASHAAEAEKAGFRRGTAQIWFNKQVSCINGPYDPVVRPKVSNQLDYEGELGVIIGKDCRYKAGDAVWEHIAGYVVCCDYSVRDWQLRAPTHTLGKSFDTHGPLGPWIVTRDEIPDVHALDLKLTVNGELRQSASTADMIHKIPALIEELSTAFTLQAGDILSTGTPAGVGGLFDPPRYLVPGDVVRVEIGSIGHIENIVVDEAGA